MSSPATLLRSIRLALETHRDGDAFRAEVKRLIAEHDTPPMFDTGPRTIRMANGSTIEVDPARGDRFTSTDTDCLFPAPPEKGTFGFE